MADYKVNHGLDEYRKETQPGKNLLILGAHGGRFDQVMSSVSSLVKWRNNFENIVLVDEHCSSYLLEKDQKHRIKLIHQAEGPTVGLIPVVGKVSSITTKNLKWDMDKATLEMGVMISSSNHVSGDVEEVLVEANEHLLWTCEIKEGILNNK